MKINFIIIFIFISLISNILSSTTYSIYSFHLQKGKKAIIPLTRNTVIFESDSFGKGDKINFKITGYKFNDDDIKFEFLDDGDPAPGDLTMKYKASPEVRMDAKDVYDSDVWSYDEGKTYYYSIKKDQDYLKNIEGKYLAIYYNVEDHHPAIVENYKKNQNTVIAIIVAVIVVVIVVVVIVVCCIRRKKRLAAEANNMNVYNGNNVNVNNYPNQGNYGPQTYNQNPNYNTNMNMNMNMNQGPHGPHGSHGPPGPYGNNNMGYNNVPYSNNPQQYSGIPQNSNTMRYG